jgi:probable F420-dependent oxidoreductase
LANASEANAKQGAGKGRRPVFSVGLRGQPLGLAAYIKHADQLGFDGIWAQETLNATNYSLDPLHQLSYAAAVSERLRLGVSVLFSGYRNPAVLARELASIDQLSQGRLTVGMGVGNAYHRPRLSALGIVTDRPPQRLVEGIAVMRALWSQEEAEFKGEIYSFSGIRSQPKPVQQPGPPIIIGARAEVAVRRAVTIADGWTGAGMIPPAERKLELAALNSELAAQGRDPATFQISVNVYISVDKDRNRARDRAQEVFSVGFKTSPVYQAEGMADRVAMLGPPEQCAEQMRQLLDQGVNELIFYPMYDYQNQLEGIAKAVELVRKG